MPNKPAPALLSLLFLLCAAALGGQGFVVMVVEQEAGLREKPGFIYKEIGRLMPGEEVIVDGQEGDWLHVAHMGWAPAGALKPRDRAAGATRYEVNVDRARLRGGPGTDHPVVGTVMKGERFDALEQDGGWIRIGEGKWVFGELVVEVTGEEPDEPEAAAPVSRAARRVEVVPGRVNLRGGPSTGHEVVGSATQGQVFEVKEEEAGWLHLSGGGWIRGDLVRDAAPGEAPGGGFAELRQWGLLSILGVYIKVIEVPPDMGVARRITATLNRLTGEQDRTFTFLSIILDVPVHTAYRFNYSPAYNRVQVTDREGRRFGNFVHQEGDVRKLPAEIRSLFLPTAVFPGSAHTGLLVFSGELDPDRIEKVEIYMSGRMHALYEEQ